MANEGVYPPNYETLAGQVRVLVGDTDPKNITGTAPDEVGEYAWYSDTELEALGSLNRSSPKRTAIWVLSQVAISQAMLLKKWTSEDLAVDGPAIAKGIEATLKRLAKDADDEDIAGGELSSFDFYPIDPYGLGDYYPYPTHPPVPAWL